MASALRNILMMGLSTAVRLVFGMLSFVIMARFLGPLDFGLLMLWLSISTLLALIANFGLTPYLLREIGAAPESAQQIMGEVLSAKILLSLSVLGLGIFGLPWVSPSVDMVFILLLCALLIESMTEFLNVGFRATNRFGEETRVAMIAALLQFAIIAAFLWVQSSILAAAMAYLVSRLLVLMLTWYAQRRYFSALRPGSLGSALYRIRTTVAYAMDFGLQSLFGQIDSLFLNHFIGPAAVGVFQAGMRVFLGGAQAATVLGNVFLPRAAAAASNLVEFQRESRLLQQAFTVFGASFGLILAIYSDLIARLLFGNQFVDLGILFPWFGVLFFTRFFAASWGVVLTSAGRQGFRAWVNVIQWCLIASLALVIVPRFGTVGWLLVLVAGNAFLGLAYLVLGLRILHSGVRSVVTTALGALAFVPFVRLPVALT